MLWGVNLLWGFALLLWGISFLWGEELLWEGARGSCSEAEMLLHQIQCKLSRRIELFN
ncbi:MAG TPA: hypothetical protein P5543_07020 [Planctomycetota bacterium]|nr:hypothetical protein [Planctomycetota bacterium]HRU51924.1 hypothetical protein [Planctomycetota bacterium]